MSEDTAPKLGTSVPRSGTAVITRDEWLAEFERVLRALPTREDGVTARELGEVWGIGPRAVMERLRRLEPGRVVAGRKTIKDLAGRTTTTFCYRLKQQE